MEEYLRDLAQEYAAWEERPQQQELPPWVNRRGDIQSKKFCDAYLHKYALCSMDKTFYDLNGAITDEHSIRQNIYDMISPYISGNLPRKVDELLETLRYECADSSALTTSIQYLHFANGTYNMSDRIFVMLKNFCRHRFPVAYNPNAPKPEKWLQFLSELLEEEDILTLQEYMGYCLFPTTRAQKMLTIIGSGGEGKSRIGVVMKALFGNALCQGSIAKVENSPFARADLQHKLVMVDDDMKMEALKQTNYIKTIITAEEDMDLERKGKQSYQGRLYVRFLAFGNGTLKSLHDRSYGFFRRQIILKTKPRPADRIDNPFLDIELKQELEGILLWCIEGWERLFVNDFRFTLSQQARKNMTLSILEGCNILEFMESRGYFLLDTTANISSRCLYSIYKDWCEDNSMVPLGARSFSGWLMENGSRYGLRYGNDIPIGNGRLARGFYGLRALPRM